MNNSDKFDDIVLSFDLQLSQFKKEVKFSKKLSKREMEYDEVSERDYNHDSFGFYTDDDILARNHFFMQMRGLSDTSSDKENYLDVACEDLRKYILARKYGTSDPKKGIPEAKRMISLILAYGGAEPLYDAVKNLHQKTLEDYDDPRVAPTDSAYFLDFYDLYEKYGDYELFMKSDVKAALRYYELASLDWYGFEEGVEWEISPNEKKGKLNRQKRYKWLKELVLRPWDMIPLWKEETVWKRESDYKDAYICYMYALKKRDRQKICEEATAFFHLLDRMITEKYTRQELRLPLLLAHGVRETSLEYLLFQIRNNGTITGIGDATKKYIFRCIRSNHDRKMIPVCNYANRVDENDETLKNCFDMLSMMEHVKKVSDLLKRDSSLDQELAYYTSLETFSYMLPFKAEEGMTGKLSIMNIAYMNDPNEGRMLQKCLFSGNIPFEGDGNRRKDARYPYVFIKCFTPQIDFLPMWEMYGDSAKGCCLVVDWKQKKKTGKKEVPLYNVCYLSKGEGKYRVKTQHNVNLNMHDCEELEKELEELTRLCKGLYKEENGCLEAVHSILNEILYLFKDASYSYEKEVRIYFQFPEVDSSFRHTAGEFGRIYVATESPVQLREVILGPKFENRAVVTPYLQEQIDLMCKECGVRVPMITISDIEYR